MLPRSVAEFFPDAKPTYPRRIKEGNSLTDIDQIAIVTADIDGAIEQLGEIFGWGPWYVIPPISGRAKKDGREHGYRIKLAFCQVGPLEIELIQPLDGDTPFHKHLTQLGAGIFHLRCVTGDVEGACRHLAQKGVDADWEHWDQGILINAYLQRLEKLGLRIELVLDAKALHAKGFEVENQFIRSAAVITG